MTDFLDTNVIVYAHDVSESAKREKALAILAGDNWTVSSQVLGEFFVTTTRKLVVPMSWQDASAAVDDLRAQPVVAITAALVTHAVQIARDHQTSYWDALIIAAAVEAGCERVLTEDLSSGQIIEGVRIHNPFE